MSNERKLKKHYIPRLGYTKGKPRKFASQVLQPMWSINQSSNIARKYTNEDIAKMLVNPYTSYNSLQTASNYFTYNSSYYTNILYYLATIMTFDYYIYPNKITNEKKGNTVMINKFERAAYDVKNIKLRTLFPNMLFRTLTNGETYWYDESDDDSFLIREIPSKFCQVIMIDSNGLYRYLFNLSYVTDLNKNEFPEEIVKAYEEYKKIPNSEKNNKRFVDGVEIPVTHCLVSNKGFAMLSHNSLKEHDYPYMASMFVDLNTFETDKEYYNNYIKEDNIKLIHSKVPVDKVTGEPLMDWTEIRDYHESIKSHTPSNVAPITNPFDTTAINMDKAQQQNVNIVEQSKKNVVDDSGVPDAMFGASTNTALKLSTLADASRMYMFLDYFTNYVNFKIKKYDMEIHFIQVNHYNKADMYKEIRSGLSTAGESRFKYIALSGSEIYDFIMLAKMEKIYDIDSFMPVKESAFQASGSSGAPTSENPTESTDKGKEYE